MPSKPRKHIADLIGELQYYYGHGPEDFPTLFWRVLASLPGGDRAADMGYETLNLGWKEAELLGDTLNAIQDTRDVEDLIQGLIGDEEEEVEEARRRPRAREAPPLRSAPRRSPPLRAPPRHVPPPPPARTVRSPRRAPPPARRRGR